MKINKVLSTIVATALIMAPVMATAQTATTTNTQLQALLSQIQALQAQIASLKQLQMQIASTTASVSSTLQIIRNLREGMSGEDVAALQAALAADPSIYPEGIISGFYGKLTAEAVRKFQKKHGIEQVGTVGPKTQNQLNQFFRSVGLSKEEGSASSTEPRGQGKGLAIKLCAKMPPGHLIAPGWQKKNGTTSVDISACTNMPKGIADKLMPGPVVPPPATTTATTTPDTTAPQISGMAAGSIMGTTTSIMWTTNENANSKVWFSTSSPVSTSGTPNAMNAGFVMSHSVALSGLSTSTTYYYVVGSTDASNNTATSTQGSFTTTAGL